MNRIQPATPLPWEQEQGHGSTHILHEGAPLASAEEPQDAAYIVAACNAHPQLVDALRAVDLYFTAIDGFNPQKERGDSGRTVRNIVRAAIAKAVERA